MKSVINRLALQRTIFKSVAILVISVALIMSHWLDTKILIVPVMLSGWLDAKYLEFERRIRNATSEKDTL